MRSGPTCVDIHAADLGVVMPGDAAGGGPLNQSVRTGMVYGMLNSTTAHVSCRIKSV